MYLLDTNIVSYWMRGDPNVIAHIKTHMPSELSLSAITMAEIWYGIAKSPFKKEERIQRITRITSLLMVYPFDEIAAQRYGSIRAELEKKGIATSERDTQIAAIAVANGLTVVTHNTKEFNRVTELMLEDWAIAQLP